MRDGQEEIISLSEVLLDSADNRGAVRVADFFRNYTDRVSALVAKRAGEEVGTVIQFLGCGMDAVLRLLRNRTSRRGVVEHCGNRSWGESQMLRNGFESDHFWFLPGLFH